MRLVEGIPAYPRQTVYVNERYENSDAAVAHLVKFAATFGERYGSLVERKRFIVFGEPSDALAQGLDRAQKVIDAASCSSFFSRQNRKE
jgi:hypothetical protein